MQGKELRRIDSSVIMSRCDKCCTDRYFDGVTVVLMAVVLIGLKAVMLTLHLKRLKCW